MSIDLSLRSFLALSITILVQENVLAYALPLPQATTYRLENFDTSTSKGDRDESVSAVAIGVVSILLASGSLVVGILGVMLYRQRERQLQASIRKEASTLALQRNTAARNTTAPNDRTHIWPQRYNIIYTLFATSFRRPALLAPFHLRRAATWGTLHSDPGFVGALVRPTESHLMLPANATYPRLPLPCLLARTTTTGTRQ